MIRKIKSVDREAKELIKILLITRMLIKIKMKTMILSIWMIYDEILIEQ